MKNNNTVTMVVIGVIALTLGFFGGLQYGNYQRIQMMRSGGAQFFTEQGGAGGGFGGRMMGGQQGAGGNRMMGRTGGSRPIYGQIVSQDDKSITVKLNDGSSKIVILSVTTSINKASAATVQDLKTGDTVAVFGTTNNDGSVTAQNVQLNPVMRGAQGTPAASPSAK